MKRASSIEQISSESRQTLMSIAKESVAAAVRGEVLEHVPPANDELLQMGAAFVTLKKKGELRGCIGHVLARIPLYMCVSEVARSAAVHDTRFAPVSKNELDELSFEISVLTAPEPISPEDVVVGRDGLVVRKKGFTGLLLPQVPVEWKWDREEFLSFTCRKAGLPLDAWKQPGVELLAFQAIVFDENQLN